MERTWLDRQLINAVNINDINTVKSYLTLPLPPTSSLEFANIITLLRDLASNGRVEMAKLFISLPIPPEYLCEILLNLFNHGSYNREITKLLFTKISSKLYPINHNYVMAIISGDMDKLRELTKPIPPVIDVYLVQMILWYPNPKLPHLLKVIEYLISQIYYWQDTLRLAMKIAVFKNLIEIVKLLIHDDYEDHDIEIWLGHAAKKHQYEIFALLLQKPIDRRIKLMIIREMRDEFSNIPAEIYPELILTLYDNPDAGSAFLKSIDFSKGFKISELEFMFLGFNGNTVKEAIDFLDQYLADSLFNPESELVLDAMNKLDLQSGKITEEAYNKDLRIDAIDKINKANGDRLQEWITYFKDKLDYDPIAQYTIEELREGLISLVDILTKKELLVFLE
jgi:hypothetical protein